MKELSEEVLARVRAEARETRDRALGLIPSRDDSSPRDSEPPEERSRRSSRQRNTEPARVKFSREEVLALHRQGKTASQIGVLIGAHRGTVNRILAELGVAPQGTGGPPRQEFCKRNHSLDKYGKPHPNGGRECQECKRERGRKWWNDNRSKAALNQETS